MDLLEILALSQSQAHKTASHAAEEAQGKVNNIPRAQHDMLDTVVGFIVNNPALMSAIVATIGLFFNARAVYQQARAIDVSSYFEIIKQFSEAQREIKSAQENDRSYEINEFLNLLEGLAHLFNSRRFPKQTKNMVRDRLIEALAILNQSDEAKSLLSQSVTSSTTFNELIKFRKQFAERISNIEKARLSIA